MYGFVASIQANSRSWRLRSELMFQDAILIVAVAAIYDRRSNSTRDNLRSTLVERRYSSSSTPGAGTITFEPGSSDASFARIHSTAGGSPCTRTIFRGESFWA